MADLAHASEGDTDLHGDPDAAHWAERFAQYFYLVRRVPAAGDPVGTELRGDFVDGVMLAWFAGAVETGRMVERRGGQDGGPVMRRFTAYRVTPPEGYVAGGYANPPEEPQFEGVVSSDGRVAVFWLTEHKSVSVWPSFDDMLAVHGHPEYGTRIVWQDG